MPSALTRTPVTPASAARAWRSANSSARPQGWRTAAPAASRTTIAAAATSPRRRSMLVPTPPAPGCGNQSEVLHGPGRQGHRGLHRLVASVLQRNLVGTGSEAVGHTRSGPLGHRTAPHADLDLHTRVIRQDPQGARVRRLSPGRHPLEGIPEFTSRRKAVVRVSAEEAQNHVLHGRRNLHPGLGEGLHVATLRGDHELVDLMRRLTGRIAEPGVPAGEQGVEDHPEGEEVGPPVHLLGTQLLRGRVPRGSQRPHGRQATVRFPLRDLRDPEVEHLHDLLTRTIRGEHDVLELHVAVHDWFGALVSGDESVTDLEAQSDGPLGGEGALLEDRIREALALDVLHEEIDEPRLEVLLVGGESHDVGRLRTQAFHDLRLPEEAFSHGLRLGPDQPVYTEDL